MNDMTLYWLPNCSTCQKAAAYLAQNSIPVEHFHDLKKQTLSRREVEKIASLLGGAENLFSRRAIKYRTLKLNERRLSDDEMLDLMAGEYTFIKRPVLVINGKAIAGFSEKSYEKFLGEF